eukprot:8953538-Pyramimonas_sp.AAC.1
MARCRRGAPAVGRARRRYQASCARAISSGIWEVGASQNSSKQENVVLLAGRGARDIARFLHRGGIA